jgi:electron transfer flavoprotein beta subunit
MKQVPDTETLIKIKPDGSGIVTDDIKYVINPYCEFAVEESLRIKEKHGGQSILITMGSQKAVEALRTGLAMGSDRSIHLNDPAFEGADGFATAKAPWRRQSRRSRTISSSRQAAVDDGGPGRRPWPSFSLHVTLITKLEISADKKKAKVEKEVEGGKEVIEVSLPAVFTCQKGLNEPRYASLPGIMKAKKKEVKAINLAALGLPADQVGAAGAKIKINKYTPPPSRPPGKIVSGEILEAAQKLVKLLREEAKIV